MNLKKSDRRSCSELPGKRQGIMVMSDRNEDLGKMEEPGVLWWGGTPT